MPNKNARRLRKHPLSLLTLSPIGAVAFASRTNVKKVADDGSHQVTMTSSSLRSQQDANKTATLADPVAPVRSALEQRRRTKRRQPPSRNGVAERALDRIDDATTPPSQTTLPLSYFDDLREIAVSVDGRSDVFVASVEAYDSISAASSLSSEDMVPIDDKDCDDKGEGDSKYASEAPAAEANHHRKTVNYDLRSIVLFAPFVDDDNGGGFNHAAAALLAAHHFNTGRHDVVPQLRRVFDADAGSCRRSCRDLRFTVELLATRHVPRHRTDGDGRDGNTNAAASVDRTALTASGELAWNIRPRFNELSSARADEEGVMEETCPGIWQKYPRMFTPNATRPYPTAMITGDLRSVAMNLAEMSIPYSLPLVTSHDVATALGNKDVYPLVASMEARVDSGLWAAMDFMALQLGATHIGAIVLKDWSYVENRAAILDAATKLGISILDVPLPYAKNGGRRGAGVGGGSDVEHDDDYDEWRVEPKEIDRALEKLRRSGLRYFYGWLGTPHPTLGADVLRAARRLGINGPDYFWMLNEYAGASLGKVEDYSTREAMSGVAILSQGLWGSTLVRRDEFSPYLAEIWNTSEGAAFFDSKLPHGASDWRLVNDSFDAGSASFNYAMLTYEAVIALALASCDAAESNRFFDGNDLFRALGDLNFDGIYYKDVAFNPATYSRDWKTMPYSIVNFLRPDPSDDGMAMPKLKHVYKVAWDKSYPNITRWVKIDDGVDFVFSNGGTTPPAILPDIEYILITKSAIIAALVSCVLSMLLSIGFAVWTYANRRTRVVASSQPIFLGMLCAGTCTMAATIIPLSLQWPIESLDGACMAMPWLYSCGFVIAFSALFSKTRRLNILVGVSRSFIRVKVRARDVIVPFAVLMTLSLAVLIAWTVVSPLTYQPVDEIKDAFGRNVVPGGCFVEIDRREKLFFSLLVIINVVAVTYATVQAFQLRMNKTEFDESRYIFVSLVLVLECFVIFVPFLVATSLTTRYCIMAAIIIFTCNAILLPVFVPKTMHLRRWRREMIERELQKARRLQRQKEQIARFHPEYAVGNNAAKMPTFPSKAGSSSIP